MSRVTVREAPGAVPSSAGTGTVLLQLISPGQGSSGYYAPKVLEQAARDRVFAAGTHSYLDHPSESERFDRPERSVKDLVGVLMEDARWTGSALVARAQLFGDWGTRVVEMADAIGVSIRATADVAEGVVRRIIEATSVDFVTKAGRGGRVLQVLEAARPGSQAKVTEADIQRGQARAFGRSAPVTPVVTSITLDEAVDITLARTFGNATAHGRRVTPALVEQAHALIGRAPSEAVTEVFRGQASSPRRPLSYWSLESTREA